jgi:predicted ATP-grasp superfamily ATP-dependent carboligase
LFAQSTAHALLTMPDYCGTLAATRCLGEAGVQVWVAGESVVAPAAYSRHVVRRLHCPPAAQDARLIEWLLDVGARRPGGVLYPTSDDHAWIQAVHADELSRHYRLYAPDASVLERLLDKRALHEACGEVGIAVPRSLYPRDRGEASAMAERAPIPLLVKPRTQVLSRMRSKGTIVRERAQVGAAFAEFRRTNSFGSAVLARMPQAALPMLQAYHSEGVSGSYLVSGFVDRTGELFVARAANKVLQRPRALGITLCAEAAPVDGALAERIRALFRHVGYYGIFQMEFLRVNSELLLIDFNPRYYHYMSFDIARGMPLPVLAHLAACGETAALERWVATARSENGSRAKAFTHGFDLDELLLVQRLTGAMSRQEAERWQAWRASYQHQLVDAVRERGDSMPSLVDAAAHVVHYLRHPGSFVRSIALGRG